MKKTFVKAIALTAAITLGAANIGFAAGGSIGYGDISVYKNDKLVSKLTGQNPVEDGSLLVCDGKCMIKSEGISLIGQDAAQVAVASEDDTFKIFVKEGKVDYIINSNVRKISFHTPDGTYTVAEVVFNASSQSAVKGSVFVDDKGQTEITVSEGRLVFATADGMKTVDANNKIVLAVATAASDDDDDAAAAAVVGGGAAAVGTAGGGAAAVGGAVAGGAVATGLGLATAAVVGVGIAAGTASTTSSSSDAVGTTTRTADATTAAVVGGAVVVENIPAASGSR